MEKFNVLAIAEQLSDVELDLVISCFSELYHRVTFKHHKRISLKVICDLEQSETVLTLSRIYKVGPNVEVIPKHDEAALNWETLGISVLFLPTAKRVGKVIRTALSQSIPVVSFENESISEYIDQSCGMLVRRQGIGQNKDTFARIVCMLYFDPEVRKLLKKGATKKYKEICGFGSSVSESSRDHRFARSANR